MKENEIILFENQGVKLEVNMKDETVWLTQAQMAELFEKDIGVISRHIKNIFKEGELEEKSNLQKMQIPNSDKPVTLYSLDVVISVGYRELFLSKYILCMENIEKISYIGGKYYE